MKPPEAPATGPEGREPGSASAVSVCADTLIDRDPTDSPGFPCAPLRHAAKAHRQFLVQARRRAEGEPANAALVRVGFTCSKKVGNAVARNRAKRRLRALARAVLPLGAMPGWDYVLVGRANATATRDFAAMKEELARALAQIHGAAR